MVLVGQKWDKTTQHRTVPEECSLYCPLRAVGLAAPPSDEYQVCVCVCVCVCVSP